MDSRNRLDEGWIRLAGGAEGAEEEGTGNDGEHDCRSEDGVLPAVASGTKGMPVSLVRVLYSWA